MLFLLLSINASLIAHFWVGACFVFTFTMERPINGKFLGDWTDVQKLENEHDSAEKFLKPFGHFGSTSFHIFYRTPCSGKEYICQLFQSKFLEYLMVKYSKNGRLRWTGFLSIAHEHDHMLHNAWHPLDISIYFPFPIENGGCCKMKMTLVLCYFCEAKQMHKKKMLLL